MGKRGPTPKPAEDQKLAGNPGKRPLRSTVKPAADASLLEPPAYLSAAAKAEWKQVVPELFRLKLLANVDRAALEGYCEAYAAWRKAQAVLAKSGPTYKTPSGFVRPRPEVKIAADAQKQLKGYLAEFGLTPAARARMSSPAPAEEEKSLADLLFEGVDDAES